MSLDATKWAWEIQFREKKGGSSKPLKRLVLLSLADRAGEDHICYPSVKRLSDDTNLDRKTVLKIIAELIEDGLITDTGERKGQTKQVKVYRLTGVVGRENKRVPTTGHLDQESGDLNSTVFQRKEYQHSHLRVPTLGHGIYQRTYQKNLKIKNRGFALKNFEKKFIWPMTASILKPS